MSADMNRLRWRCRRGLLELDVLLREFLDQRYADLSDSERIAFERLLGEADQSLSDWFGGATPPPDDLKRIISEISQVHDL